MILAIDVGNSNIVVCGVDGSVIRFEERILTDANKVPSEYVQDLDRLLQKHGILPENVEGAIVASVVPDVQTALLAAIKYLTGRGALAVGPELKTGLEILTDDPSEIGADLIVGSVAAMKEYPLPLIVVDLGTANTVMALNAQGAFIGGAIAPGLKMSMNALFSGTALLPELDLVPPEKAIGTNTIDCMRSGVILGTACMLDGILQRMEEELGSKATVVITGGIARHVYPLCRREMIYDENLLIKGLIALYRDNTPVKE